jgi:hypothetical protein
LARLSSVLFLAGAFMVLSAARADATLIVWVCDDPVCAAGGDFVAVDDGGSDADSTDGSISFIIAGYANVLASSYPAQGSAADPVLTLNYSLTADAFATFGTPYVFAAQDSFTASPGTMMLQANSALGGGTASFYAGPGTFGPPPFAGAPILSCALDCATSFAPAPASPYHLAIGVAPTAGPGAGASGDASILVSPVQTVPDGGSTAALLGSILLGFGMLRRKFNL